MAEVVRVAVVGGGVTGLCAAWHLVELWQAAGPDTPRLEIDLVAMLLPHEGGDGSGVGGKAMSRSWTGWIDDESGFDRHAFYGPMMPWSGCVPHGYHILWEYPNLRRMLGDADGTGTSLHLRPPGGAACLGAFQGLLDDPAPGGPGIAVIGLCDPSAPESARTDAARALLRLGGTALVHPFLRVFERIFGEIVPEADPLVFADVLFAHELDVEMRIALIGGTLTGLATNPEVETVWVDGRRRPLYDVEYDTWAQGWLTAWARRVGEHAPGFARALVEEAAREWRRSDAFVLLAEGLFEADPATVDRVRQLLPEAARPLLDDVRCVYLEVERVLRDIPSALARLATGRYPAWRSLHFRFAPDATFASPFSYDAAQALRSLTFCYRNPRSARMWSVDGQRFQGLWTTFWARLQAAVVATRGGVVLHAHEGRVDRIDRLGSEDGPGLALTWGPHLGHGGAPLAPRAHDLGMPHTPDLGEGGLPGQAPDRARLRIAPVDVIVGATPPGALAALLPGEPFAAARAQLAPVSHPGNETLELLLWLDEPIGWAPLCREALAGGAIGGLEGAFCMVSDYACGLWSEDVFAAERPFEGRDTPFAGSILEACGCLADVFACATRDDAYGWPGFVKDALVTLLGDPAFFATVDERRWPHDEEGWRSRRADGTWTPERAASREGWEDWVVASRWLVFGYLRQLSGIQSLGPQAVRQLAAHAELLDPRRWTRAEILDPPESLRQKVRYVVMRNTKARNRFYSPGVGEWPHRPISGRPLEGAGAIFPAGDWTRNGLDVVCMEAACLSAMRASRAAWTSIVGPVPAGAPAPIPVLPRASWYGGLDPEHRGPDRVHS
jgi:hypothetical protein